VIVVVLVLVRDNRDFIDVRNQKVSRMDHDYLTASELRRIDQYRAFP
jgi:hypothetical protein